MNLQSTKQTGKTARRFLDPQVLARLKRLDLVAKYAVEGFMAGLHKSPYHGFSTEFSEHRQYIPGDPVKFLDWRVLARSDRLYLKRFEDETNLRAHILLDRSGTMAFGSPVTKWDYARMVAASVAYMLLKQRDAAGLAFFDNTIKRSIPARSTHGHLDILLSSMDEVTAEGETDPTDALHRFAEQLTRSGLVILISDLLLPPTGENTIERMTETWVNILKHFRHQGHDVIVFHVLHPDEVEFQFSGPVRFDDLEGDSRLVVDTWAVGHLYREHMKTYLDTFQRTCRENGVDYYRLMTNEPLDLALSACLDKRKRLY